MENGRYVDGSVWFFAPNKGAPIFFAIAFFASGCCHLWQTIRYKCWRLTGLYVICSFLFVAGFIVRELGAFDYGDLIKYIVSICLVYAAPPDPLFRPYYSPIHPGRVLTTFAAISMVVEALNGNGAAYAVNQSLPQSQRDTGKALLQAALLIQIAIVLLFVTLAVYFHIKCRRNGINSAKVSQPLATLYMSSAIITARTLYRVVEYFDIANVDFSKPDFDPMSISPIVRYEWFFYVFEASLMLTNSVLLNARHPRRWLPKSTKVYLARDGVSEIAGPGYKQDRNFFITLVDPFDIYGMIKGKDRQTRFWDTERAVGQQEVKPSSNGAAKH
ncbi:RTA1 like protein-domain-containing protein [Apiospora kogelbergensis]|uniref:RTA1 like protein-domain-containing protein n=1 Tax=Apiospora kogelbergensis TaxID=1337665 RepID=UPI00312D93AB